MHNVSGNCACTFAKKRGLICTSEGVFIWPGIALIKRRGSNFIRVSDQEICNRAAALYGASIIGGPLIRTLDPALRFLECGQVEQAKVSIEHLNLSPASPRGIVLISDASSPFFG